MAVQDTHTFTHDEVMAAVLAMKAAMQAKSRRSSSSGGSGGGGGGGSRGRAESSSALSLGMTDALEVKELAAPEVMDAIERLVIAAAEKILGGAAFELSVPSRSAGNQVMRLFGEPRTS